MSTLITINVKNNTNYVQNFFFFQAPAQYSGGPQVYSNSLYTSALGPYATTGAVLTFQLMLQYYAGVQQQTKPPAVGSPSGSTAASQAIGLTPASGGPATNNFTQMSVNPLGLSVPTPSTAPQPGSFRIATPPYNSSLQNYNAGSAVLNVDSSITLSNFVTAQPQSNIDCQPVLQFYVATGTYTPGTVMNFTQSSQGAALCDATSGFGTFSVVYNPDGSWAVTPFAADAVFDLTDAVSHRGGSGTGSASANAEIRNEANTGRLALGTANNFDPPVLIRNLNPANPVRVLGEYPIGPVNGPYRGRQCTNINAAGTEAVFS